MEIPQDFVTVLSGSLDKEKNFNNVMKQTTIGQAFKKWENFFIYFMQKINLNFAKCRCR